MRLLVTRPEAEGRATLARLAALGHEGVALPLFHMVRLVPQPVEGADAIAFTSAQAVVHWPPLWGEALRALPVFAVGDRTAKAARTAGFHKVTSANGDVFALARLIAMHLPKGRVLHPCGVETAQDLAALLGSAFNVIRRPLYQAEALDVVPPLPEGLDGVLHYSPRAAEVFIRHYASRVAQLRHYCLSPTIAAQLAMAGGVCSIAERPREDALLALLQD